MQPMTTSTRYTKAPITEAVIDIHVEPSEMATLPNLDRYCTEQAGSYPSKAPLKMAFGELTLEPELSSSAHSKQLGFVCTRADGKQIFQSLLNSFKMNVLAPYPGWEPFRDEARRLWNLYRVALQPRKITRIAVRYVNRLDLPMPVPEMKEYLRASPDVPPDLPQGLDGFLMQLIIRLADIKCTLQLQEARVAPPTPGVASIILDIDLFRTDDLPSDETAIWSVFEMLRARKNQVFEACVTDKYREMIR